jgi:prevent-host-death family protein
MVNDHGRLACMIKEAIPISEFKARCLAVLRRVKATGRPVVVTRLGEAVAEIVPPTPAQPVEPWLGSLKDRGEITGDIVAPVADPTDWHAMRA